MSKRFLFPIFCVFFLLPLSCAPTKPWTGKIVNPKGVIHEVNWMPNERANEISVRQLFKNKDISTQIVRLRTAEKPHIHEHHDLVVFVLKGKAVVHVGNRTYKVKPGDIVEIPRGVPHWAENRSSKPSEVYAVFTPRYDGKDTKPI